MARKLFIAGNWKMNKTPSEAKKLASELKAAIGDNDSVDMAVCPTFVALAPAVEALKGSNIKVGAQNMYFEDSGAYTGEISADMLLDIPVEYVILGHSERRSIFGETNADINAKVKKALEKGLKPIVCIGETLEEREADKTEAVVAEQIKGSLADLSADDMKSVTIAYEPVWAIGTGRTATPEQAQDVHVFVRGKLRDQFGTMADQIRIQYGGSVKPANAKELMSQPDIDGALVGGASLKADDFAGIINAS
jgi:triosephosphate isomerase